MPSKKIVPIKAEIVRQYPELPSVPDAFSNTEYDGWLEERIKRFQLKTYQRTQAERVVVLKQINELQVQCLALKQHEADWRHFAQEDRLRQKRLDIQEIELDMRLVELQEQRDRPREVPVPRVPETRDPVKEALNRLRNKIRIGVEARVECDHLKEEFPSHAHQIEAEFRKMIWDLREDV